MTEKRIYLLSGVWVSLATLAFIIPRFVPDREGGFASAATAVLVFLGIWLVSVVLSLYLLVVTLQSYRQVSFLPRLAGMAPSVITIAALVLLLGLLRY